MANSHSSPSWDQRFGELNTREVSGRRILETSGSTFLIWCDLVSGWKRETIKKTSSLDVEAMRGCGTITSRGSCFDFMLVSKAGGRIRVAKLKEPVLINILEHL